MLQKEIAALSSVFPEHMHLGAVVEETGEAGSGRGLRGTFGVGSRYHLGFGHGPFHADEHISTYLYVHSIFPCSCVSPLHPASSWKLCVPLSKQYRPK